MSLAVVQNPKHPLPSAHSASTSRAPKFGFIGQAFMYLENNPMTDLAVKDIACYMVPQASLARSKDELRDMLPNSIGLLVNTIASMVIIPQILRAPVAKLTGVSKESLKAPLTQGVVHASNHLPAKEQLARLAIAFGFLLPFTAIEMAIPFYRNWLTLKRTGTADFEHLIGLEGKRHTSSAEKQEQESKRQIKGMSTIMGVGTALGALSVLSLSMLAKRADTLSESTKKLTQTLFRQFTLSGKKSYEIQGMLSTMLFWLIPPYLGWVLAARSKNERIEHTIKGANSVLWFSLLTPLAVKPFFMRRFEKLGVKTGTEEGKGLLRYYKGSIPEYGALQKLAPEIQEKAMKIRNRYSIFSWIIPVAALAVTPQLLNIHLTKKRYEKAQKNYAAPTTIQPPPVVSTNPFMIGAAAK